MNLERKTVHISDDTGRIAMYEYRTVGSDPAPLELMGYIYSNNLSSAMLELDDNGNIISYEEYHPFGTTAYQATNASINAVAKRYRYTGKERDEESGLYYHGARYYIPWLCRWTQCDPIGIKDGLNVYAYCSNNPVMLSDPKGTQAQGREEKPEGGNDKLVVPAIAPSPAVDNCVAPASATMASDGYSLPPTNGTITADTTFRVDEIAPQLFMSLISTRVETDKGVLEFNFSLTVKITNAQFAVGVVGGYLLYGFVNSLSRAVQNFVNQPLGLGDTKNLDGTYAYQGSYDQNMTEKTMDFVNLVSLGFARFVSAIESSGTLAVESAEMTSLYRGTSNAAEIAIADESGYLMSDAARTSYLSSRGAGYSVEESVGIAQKASESAHASQVATWYNSESSYMQAHSLFGSELSTLGQRSLVSSTSEFSIAKSFSNGGRIFEFQIPKNLATPTPLSTSTESEFIIRHMIKLK